MSNRACASVPAGVPPEYVELLDEGVEVWRPVEALAESEDTFRLPAQLPDDESWRFAPDPL